MSTLDRQSAAANAVATDVLSFRGRLPETVALLDRSISFLSLIVIGFGRYLLSRRYA
ncbi:MAG: hypothetical protein ACRDIY_07580 [Chloroflexota bacterium]